MEEYNTQQMHPVLTDPYQFAAESMIHRDKTAREVKMDLVKQGMDESNAQSIVDEVESQINNAHNAKANKDMLYGALWVVGGLILTFAKIGFIFWGAILFGGIQFFRGLMNKNS